MSLLAVAGWRLAVAASGNRISQLFRRLTHTGKQVSTSAQVELARSHVREHTQGIVFAVVVIPIIKSPRLELQLVFSKGRRRENSQLCAGFFFPAFFYTERENDDRF